VRQQRQRLLQSQILQVDLHNDREDVRAHHTQKS
jgi:hypothetical protein